MIQQKFQRWDVKTQSPEERCTGSGVSGQCPFVKINDTPFCPRHGHNRPEATEFNEIRNTYRVRRWQEKLDKFANDDFIRSLRGEIAILRMIMEETLQKCNDATDLLLASHRLSELAGRIERLVVSCDRLETKMGEVVGKNIILQVALEYVNIITQYIEDPEVIDSISEQMLKVTHDTSINTTSE